MNKIASVVLNYNSFDDLIVLIPQLLEQKCVSHTVIIVDNNSNAQCRNDIKKWLKECYPKSVIGSFNAVFKFARSEDCQNSTSSIFCIFNDDNRGYSAGNNIGIRVAEALKAEAILISNPDMRINDDRYLNKLADALFASEKYYVAGSRIVDTAGTDQNPQRETNFIEELFWPYHKLIYKITGRRPLVNAGCMELTEVQKLSGCCLMIRTTFLVDAGLLDENVFLYSEEAILSRKVISLGGKMIYIPTLKSHHAHKEGDAIRQCRSSVLFIESRIYYIRKYSDYSNFQKLLLRFSYKIMKIFFISKEFAYKAGLLGRYK